MHPDEGNQRASLLGLSAAPAFRCAEASRLSRATPLATPSALAVFSMPLPAARRSLMAFSTLVLTLRPSQTRPWCRSEAGPALSAVAETARLQQLGEAAGPRA
jgi:hypothetical protein